MLNRNMVRAAILAVVGAIALAPAVSAQTAAKPGAPNKAAVQTFAKLPDWSGAWTRDTGGFFEATPAQALEPAPRAPSPRLVPPFTPKFQAIYEENLRRIAADRYPDPISICGTPAGWPRLLATPDAYEFVVRPEQVWILSENGPNIARIYTDGRKHPPEDEMWNTFTGSSVGHWEGDTLVFNTIGLKGNGSTIMGRTGIVMSDNLMVDTRIRMIAPDRLLVTIVLTDKEALTRPWPIAFTFARLPKGTTVWDYACAENNRNPITASGETLTLGTDGKVIEQKK